MKNKVCFCGIEEHCGYQIETDMEQHDKVIYEQGYNKAIDDFASELSNKDNIVRHDIDELMECSGNFDLACSYLRVYIDKIAEQLKAGGIDGNERTDN